MAVPDVRNEDNPECLMPRVERLVMPAGYGDTATALPWADVRARLTVAKQYWVATNRRQGSPHLVPVDGLWVDDVLYYGGSPDTLHVGLARADPRVTIHLPDPWNVVVVEGVVDRPAPEPPLARHLADLANEKYAEYGMEYDTNSYSDPFALHPRRAVAWSSFPTDATRFVFDA